LSRGTPTRFERSSNGRGHEVRINARRGTEYVVSTHLTRDRATEIANRLRQHLDPAISSDVVD